MPIPEEQTQKLTAEQLQQMYPELQKTPKDILEYLLAEETAQGIASICLEFGIAEEEKLEKIAYLLGLVVLDKISLVDFRELLEDYLQVEVETSEKMMQKIRETIVADKNAIMEAIATQQAPTQPKAETPPQKEESPPPSPPEKIPEEKIGEGIGLIPHPKEGRRRGIKRVTEPEPSGEQATKIKEDKYRESIE